MNTVKCTGCFSTHIYTEVDTAQLVTLYLKEVCEEENHSILGSLSCYCPLPHCEKWTYGNAYCKVSLILDLVYLGDVWNQRQHKDLLVPYFDASS